MTSSSVGNNLVAEGRSLNVLAAIAKQHQAPERASPSHHHQRQQPPAMMTLNKQPASRVQGVVVHPRSSATRGKKNGAPVLAYKQKPSIKPRLNVVVGGGVLRTPASSKPQEDNVQSPTKFLQELFEKHQKLDRIPKRATMGDFTRPSEEEVQCYNDAVRFVRGNELEKLKALHQEGKNLDACNRVGESLLMVACRRGHTELADFLIQQVRVRVDLLDDFGRTLMHDACWRPEPCPDLMDVLIRAVSPKWLLAQDVRGHTPFDYTRREHWGCWIKYLKEREEIIFQRLSLI